MCRWRSNGSAVYIRFGTSLSVTVPDETATSAIDGTTKVLTVGTNAPHEKVNASEVSQFFIPSWATHLNYKSTGTSLVGPWTVKGE